MNEAPTWPVGATIVNPATGTTARLAHRERGLSCWGWMLADCAGFLPDFAAPDWQVVSDA